MDLIKNLPSKYCRICFKDKGQSLKPINVEVRENFNSITDIHVSSINYRKIIFNFLILAHKI